MNRCSGDQCAEAVLIGAVQAPVDACEPFPTDVCSSPQLDALLSAATPTPVSSGLDPKTARLIKGLVWGAFTASTATAVGLFAANAAGAGRLVGDAEMNTQPLLRPAYTATALAAITLGVAIPTSLVLQRAQKKATHVLSPSLTTSAIQCPN